MVELSLSQGIRSYQHQADATIDKSGGTPPASGTKYEWTDGTSDLGTQKNVRIYSIEVAVTWTVQPTPLEIHITLDGESYTASQTNPVSTTEYYVTRTSGADGFSMTTTDNIEARAFLFEGRSVKIEAETTGGTVSALAARIKYAKIV